MEEPTKYLIEEIAAPIKNALVGGPFGSNLVSSDYVSDGVPVIRGQNMGFGRWVTGTFAFVTREKSESLNANIAKPGDIVFTQRGTLGQVALVPETPFERYVISQSQMKLTVNENKADAMFIYYVFRTEEQLRHILHSSIQTGVPHTNLGILRKTSVLLPALKEQKAAAKILSSLDDKIELNQRMNATLEAIAQALFKAWFIDFEPVRANMENRPSESASPEIAKFFPSEFENDIPKGWEVKKLGEVLEAKGGTTPSTKNPTFWDGENYWATPKDLSNLKFPVLLSTERKITDEGVRQISSGILPKGTLLLSSRAPIGYLSISQIPVSINQGFIAIRPKEVSNLFMLYWLMQNMEAVKSRANGSTFQEISKSSFREVEIIVASSHILNLFEKKVQSLFERIVSNEKENTKLEKIRDSLLPRLISGKISVGRETQ